MMNARHDAEVAEALGLLLRIAQTVPVPRIVALWEALAARPFQRDGEALATALERASEGLECAERPDLGELGALVALSAGAEWLEAVMQGSALRDRRRLAFIAAASKCGPCALPVPAPLHEVTDGA